MTAILYYAPAFRLPRLLTTLIDADGLTNWVSMLYLIPKERRVHKETEYVNKANSFFTSFLQKFFCQNPKQKEPEFKYPLCQLPAQHSHLPFLSLNLFVVKRYRLDRSGFFQLSDFEPK